MLKNRIKTKCKDNRGQQLLEMCIALPVLIIIIGFLITGAQLMSAKLSTTHGCYEAARSAVVCTNYSDAKSNAVHVGEGMMNSALGNVTAENIDLDLSGAWQKGNFLTCRIKSSVIPLFPVLSMDDDGSISVVREKEVSSEISMMIENE